MDHRTIVSFFTCQLVWVNRYPHVTDNALPEFFPETERKREGTNGVCCLASLDTHQWNALANLKGINLKTNNLA